MILPSNYTKNLGGSCWVFKDALRITIKVHAWLGFLYNKLPWNDQVIFAFYNKKD
jgi:hypothetical protein